MLSNETVLKVWQDTFEYIPVKSVKSGCRVFAGRLIDCEKKNLWKSERQLQPVQTSHSPSGTEQSDGLPPIKRIAWTGNTIGKQKRETGRTGRQLQWSLMTFLSGVTWWISALKEHCRFIFFLLFFAERRDEDSFLKYFSCQAWNTFMCQDVCLLKKKIVVTLHPHTKRKSFFFFFFPTKQHMKYLKNLPIWHHTFCFSGLW